MSAQPAKPAGGLARALPAAWLLIILIPYTLLVAAAASRQDVVTNLDFWYHTGIGQRLNWADARTLVHGYYPLGYPLALRLGIDAGVDALRLAQGLSWLGGALALAMVFGLALAVTRRPALAVAGALLPVANVNFVSFGALEGNDMPAAGLQLLALYLLWRCAPETQGRAARGFAAAAGFVLGLAYLTRYTALVLLPIALVYLVWRAGRPARRAVACAVIFLGAFALASAVQTVPSLLVHGTPFWNLQAKNVWFGIYGRKDWVRLWTDVPDTISLGDVVALDPGRFLTHWADETWRGFTGDGGWPVALQLAWLAGLVLILLDRRLHPARRALFVLALSGSVVAVALAWVSPRFLLVPACLEAVAMARAAGAGVDGLARLRVPVRAAGAVTLGALALLALPGYAPLPEWLSAPVPTAPHTLTAFLRAAGMADPDQVLSNDPLSHATDVPARTRYAQSWFFVPYPETLDDLLDADIAARWRFGEYEPPPAPPGETTTQRWRYLVFNYAAGFGHYRPIQDTLLQAKARLVPLAVDEAATVFCVQPCAVAGEQADDVLFDSGMRLLGHAAFAPGEQAGVYLFWRAERAPERSHKVSVRVSDSAGNLMAQVDNIPQAWTYPTDEWTAGERVVDFYYLPSLAGCRAGCRLAVVVYDAETGEPVAATDGHGARVGPLVDLGAWDPAR